MNSEQNRPSQQGNAPTHGVGACSLHPSLQVGRGLRVGGLSAGISSSIGRGLRVGGRSAGITSAGRPAAGGENKEAVR